MTTSKDLSIPQPRRHGITYNKRRTWLALLILALAAAGAYMYYSRVYAPTQTTTTQPAVQTATVRQGDLVIYASGTGTLTSTSQASFGFGSSGQVRRIYSSVGDPVEAGEVIAELSNTSILTSYDQAKRALAELTSPAAVATAQQDLALAVEDVAASKARLEYLISPAVLAWEERLVEAQASLSAAQVEAQASPSDEANQKVKEAEVAVKLAEANLRTAQAGYDDYVIANFTETTTNPRTGEEKVVYYFDDEGNRYTNVFAPSEADIDAARASYDLAKATLNEAGGYLAAVNGEEIPEGATGSALEALQRARESLLAAEEDLENTTLVAPISGTIMSLDINVGDSVGSSTMVVTIADLAAPYLEVFLDESDWANVRVGYPADVTFDILPDKTFTGEVTQVDPGLHTSGNTTVVRALVRLEAGDSFNLPLGTTAAVDVIGGRAEAALLVPVEALRETSPGEYAVFVMEDGTPKLRLIEVGIQDLLYAEVKSGLVAGEIVTTGITETQ